MKKQVIGEALGCLTQAWGLLQTGMPYSVLLLETYLFIVLLILLSSWRKPQFPQLFLSFWIIVICSPWMHLAQQVKAVILFTIVFYALIVHRNDRNRRFLYAADKCRLSVSTDFLIGYF